jgi:hypothetical protein
MASIRVRHLVQAAVLLAVGAARAAAEPDPCLERPDLDRAAFKLVFQTSPSAAPIELLFRFEDCSPYLAEDSPHGRLKVDEAIRRYREVGGYKLVLVTPRESRGGNGRTELALVREVHSIHYGSIDTPVLAGKAPIALGKQRLMKATSDEEVEGAAILIPQ